MMTLDKKTQLNTIKVLCVDDNPMVGEGLAVQFEFVPDIHFVGSVLNADEMLRVLQGNCPDVILLDYDMPGMPAFKSIEQVEAICEQTRVLMFSGHVNRDLVKNAIDAGAWGYVAKFDSQDELLLAIRQVASGSLAFSKSARNGVAKH